jgi:hypothetical protein
MWVPRERNPGHVMFVGSIATSPGTFTKKSPKQPKKRMIVERGNSLEMAIILVNLPSTQGVRNCIKLGTQKMKTAM